MFRPATAPYVFAEYPKWIVPPGGTAMIVQSRAEEDAILSDTPAVSSDDETAEANQLTGEAPKRRGWPKGKPRKPKVDA